MLRVLHVEDEESSVLLVQRLLARRADVRLDLAGTGTEALRLVAQSRPHLVLLDLHLPDVPGETVLRRLVAGRGGGGVQVVVLTADAQPDTATRLLAGGACEVLTKPLDVARFYGCVDAARAALRRAQQAC